jgi:hypothetical protein
VIVARLRRISWIALHIFAVVLMLGGVALVIAPVFINLDTYGQHDWDQMQGHRYLAIKTIKRYHQFPFWNPYSCGGHTWWGGLESGSNLVSLFFPAYLFLPLVLALRVEVVGAALLSAIGTWLLASRFTRSPALRIIVTLGFAVNGRFSEQASVGHTWHLYYAWLPWVMYFLDRAIALAPSREPPKHVLRDVVLAAVCLAMMVYNGGIYPMPQTVLVVALYAISCAASARSWRPIGLAIASGVLSFCFAAPRLLPVLEVVRKYPRLVDSTESFDLAGLIGVYTSKEGAHPQFSQWGWHEWGIYTGWIPFLLVLFAFFGARRARERALRLAGGACFVLALGRFSEYSPWAILHDHFPIFESQHVPSRWLYPATLLLLVCSASVLERVLARTSRRGLLEVALIFVAAYAGLTLGLEAQRPLVGAFVRRLPRVEESMGPFHQERVAPMNMHYDATDWAPVAMPPMMANIGVLDCATFPGLNSYFRDHLGRLPGLGAHARGDAEYHGETYFAEGPGNAQIQSWSPNEVVVHYDGARAGDALVLNQNWDPGWRANGSSTAPFADVVSSRVTASSGEVTFRYRPRLLVPGILLFVASIAALFVVRKRQREKRP